MSLLFLVAAVSIHAEKLNPDAEQFDVQSAMKNYDPMSSRLAPPTTRPNMRANQMEYFPGSNQNPNNPRDVYQLTRERLDEIRREKMYPFFDQDGEGKRGDWVSELNDNSVQIQKQLNFLLPFFGFGFNYTWISIHGFLGFSDSMESLPLPPLQFPVQTWPKDKDPSFIGPFYSRCRIGRFKESDADKRLPGVYFRMERDLPARYDQMGVEIRERIKWDIREGIVGAENFLPKHSVIVTWKNVTFIGGYNSFEITNTFQVVIVTDEVRTYAMFNYAHLGWSTHAEAGGDSSTGQGGVPAFVGFNAGNGTRAYEYKPYSQDMRVRDLTYKGFADSIPGRHIFRIDERVMSGNCFDDETVYTTQPLMFAPESGNMMGGMMVNVTGPCFSPDRRIICRFDTQDVVGKYVDQNRAVCIMPRVYATGYVDLTLSIDGGNFNWKGRFYVETPITAPEMVWFQEPNYHGLNTPDLRLRWDKTNLTVDESAKVRVSIWGYREDSVEPSMEFIDLIADGVNNNGDLKIFPSDYANRDNGYKRKYVFGFIQLNLTTPDPKIGMSPILWSRPIPLGWYFHRQWERFDGAQWNHEMCHNWISQDRDMRPFAYELPICPCMLHQATSDKGRFVPDFECDKFGNAQCYYHQGAQMCYRSGLSDRDGAGQQCCYDKDGLLMMTGDNKWGGNPGRSHNLGLIPWNEAGKVPTLSHWHQDVMPFYFCCLWQTDGSEDCEAFRLERRASQDCVGYQPPGAAAVFGDPHFYTFDNMTYTFNGRGEFSLVHVDSVRHKLDVQGRFEAVPNNVYGTSRATVLTGIAAQENTSVVVEVRLRPPYAQWRYRLDVIVDNRYVYFDTFSRHVQNFKGVTVYTPTSTLNQSQVIIMFQSGAGVEVVENNRHMSCRVYLPLTYMNQTRGLFGNWSTDITDDFTLPDGSPGPSMDVNNLETLHNYFGMKWSVDDKMNQYKGRSLFLHENGRSSNFYYDEFFKPIFDVRPLLPLNYTSVNSTSIEQACGNSYQCYYDYSVTLNRQYGVYAKYYLDEIVNIKSNDLKKVISCGVLPAPKHGRKSTFAFTPGTFVKFECDPGYVLTGEERRWCYASAEWNWAVWGEAECIPEIEYHATRAGMIAGIVLALLIPIACGVYWSRRYIRDKRAKQQTNFRDPKKWAPSGPSRKDDPILLTGGGRAAAASEPPCAETLA